ncbi:Sulfate/thiosulfate import ATP-binding protein CysA [bacterium AB1]|nr:Sulfate/thiosulfate import ATP-binding protein CysA [bacterium AB1]
MLKTQIKNIILKRLTKIYNKNVFLKNINLKINNNTCTGILGLSASGKSTLSNIISGYDSEYTGNIFFDDVNVDKYNIYERKVKIISNETTLFNSLSVYNNIYFGFRDDCNYTEEEKKSKIIHLLKKYNLYYIKDYKCGILSSGQKQKIMILRAIIDKLNCLILDEAFTNIDINKKQELYHLINQINKNYQIPIIVISHYIEEIIHLTNEVILINQGEVIQHIKTDKIFDIENLNIHLVKITQRYNIVNVESHSIENETYSFKIDNDSYINCHVSNIVNKENIDHKYIICIPKTSEINIEKNNNSILDFEFEIIQIKNFEYYFLLTLKHKNINIEISTTHKYEVYQKLYINVQKIIILKL